MKKKIDGKRFSKRESITYASDEEFTTFMQDMDDLATKTTLPDGRTTFSLGGWKEVALSASNWAKQYLAAKKLPSTFQVFTTDKTTWHEKTNELEIDKNRHFEIRTVAFHITALGYHRDSLEDIAARIIVTSHLITGWLDQHRVDTAVSEAIELGRLITLASVYGQEFLIGQRGGKAPKRRNWGDLVAKHLLDKHPNCIKEDIWNAIPGNEPHEELETDQADIVFYRDGDQLFVTIDGGEVKEMKKSTFFKNYLRKGK